MTKKPTTKKAAGAKPRAAKKDKNLKPIGDALKPLADEAAARAAEAKNAARSGRGEVVSGPNVDLVNGMKVTPSAKVVSLAKGYISLKKDAQGAAGAISDMLSKAEERNHLNRKAFSKIMPFHTMSDAQLAIIWPVFLKYADDLGIPDRATRQAEMFKEEEKPEDDGQTDIEDAAAEAAKAATGLAPGRRPSMRLVPAPASEGNDAA